MARYIYVPMWPLRNKQIYSVVFAPSHSYKYEIFRFWSSKTFVLTSGMYGSHIPPPEKKRKKENKILYWLEEYLIPTSPAPKKKGKTHAVLTWGMYGSHHKPNGRKTGFCTHLRNAWNPPSPKKKERETRLCTDLRNAFTNSLRFFGLVRLRSVSW